MIHHAKGSSGIKGNDEFIAYRKEFVGDFFFFFDGSFGLKENWSKLWFSF